MASRKRKLFPKGGLRSLYSRILWITPRRNFEAIDAIINLMGYTANAGPVFTAPAGSVGMMLANDEKGGNRIGLIWQKDNRQSITRANMGGKAQASNHKYLIRKLIRAVR